MKMFLGEKFSFIQISRKKFLHEFDRFITRQSHFQSWNDSYNLILTKNFLTIGYPDKKNGNSIRAGHVRRNMNILITSWVDNDTTRNAILAFYYFESRASRAERNACAF